MTRNPIKSTVYGVASLLLLAGSGCSSTSLFGYIPAIPVERVPNSVLGRPREDMQEISLSRLRQRPRDVYQLGANDILGIYIETILGNAEEAGLGIAQFVEIAGRGLAGAARDERGTSIRHAVDEPREISSPRDPLHTTWRCLSHRCYPPRHPAVDGTDTQLARLR